MKYFLDALMIYFFFIVSGTITIPAFLAQEWFVFFCMVSAMALFVMIIHNKTLPEYEEIANGVRLA